MGSSSLLGGLKIKMLPSVILLLIISSSSILVSSSPLFFNTGNSNLDLALGGATLGGLGGLFLGGAFGGGRRGRGGRRRLFFGLYALFCLASFVLPLMDIEI